MPSEATRAKELAGLLREGCPLPIMAGRITRRGETDQPPRVLFADFRRAARAIAGEQTND